MTFCTQFSAAVAAVVIGVVLQSFLRAIHFHPGRFTFRSDQQIFSSGARWHRNHSKHNHIFGNELKVKAARENGAYE